MEVRLTTRRPGSLSAGSLSDRKGLGPVPPASSRTTTTSLVAALPSNLRQPKKAAYTVLSAATAGRTEGPSCPAVLRDSMEKDLKVAPPFRETSIVAVRPLG